MSVTLFVTILTLGSTLSSFLTEAIKKWYENAGKKCSPNSIALFNSIVIGLLGTAITYILSGIPWTINNVICMILMTFVVWICSMIGYDKVIQWMQQVKQLEVEKSKTE